MIKQVLSTLMCMVAIGLVGCDSPFADTPPIPKPGNLVANTTQINTAGENVVKISNIGELPITVNSTKLDGVANSITTSVGKDEINNLKSNCNGNKLYPHQSCNIDLNIMKSENATDNLKLQTSVGSYTYPIKIVTSAGDLDIGESASITQVGDNKFAFVNHRNVTISLNSIKLQTNNTQDSSIDLASCQGVTLNQGESCGFTIKAMVAESGSNNILVGSNIGDYDFSIPVKTPDNDITINKPQITNVGANTLALINNSKNPITLNSITMTDNQTQDTLNANDCIAKTLKAGQTCNLVIKDFKSENGNDVINVNSDVGMYAIKVAVQTGDNDLVLDTQAITTAGTNTMHFTNTGSGVLTIQDVAFSTKGNMDTVDISDCIDKTLTHNQQCDISITTLDKEAGNDTLIAISDVGKYTNSVKIDSTGAGVLVTSDGVVDTTAPKTINIANVGTLPVSLKSFHLDDTSGKADTSIALQDGTCEGKTLNGGSSCTIQAKAVGGKSARHYANFLTANMYMKQQPVNLLEETDRNNMIFTLVKPVDTESSVTTVLLGSQELKTVYISNQGSNDLNIQSIKLSNSNIGKITKDECTGKNLYAHDFCTVSVQPNKDAHGVADLVVTTPQVQPQDKISFTVANKSLTYSGNSLSDSMPTEVTKTFTISNPNPFDVTISNVTFDTALYSVLENKCNGVLNANATCNITLKSSQVGGASKIVFISPDFENNPSLEIVVSSGAVIAPANIPGQVFLQEFVVNNNGYDTGTIAVNNQSGGRILGNGEHSELFAGTTNCAANNQLPQQGHSCKYILSEDANNPNANYGNIGFTIQYSKGATYSHTYQPHTARHMEHRNATYQPNQFINANQPILNDRCWVKGKMASAVFYQPDGFGGSTIAGYILKVGNDGVTPYVIPFFGNKGSCWSAYNRFEELPINAYWVVSRTPILHIFPFSGMESNFYLETGGYCNDTTCTLPISIFLTGISSFNTPIVFAKPQPAKDWTVVDSIVWSSL